MRLIPPATNSTKTIAISITLVDEESLTFLFNIPISIKIVTAAYKHGQITYIVLLMQALSRKELLSIF